MKQSTFSHVTLLQFDGYSRNPRLASSAHGLETEVWLGSLKIKGTFLVEQSTLSIYLVFHSRDFPETPNLELYAHALQNM